MRCHIISLTIIVLLLQSCRSEENEFGTIGLRIAQDETTGAISIYHTDGTAPILVQNAEAEFRPYIHPIVAPDGKGILTEYSPGHHKHQTGLYWGFTRVNGRDFFITRAKTIGKEFRLKLFPWIVVCRP